MPFWLMMQGTPTVSYTHLDVYKRQEELYEYLIFTVSPLAGEYEPGKAEFGFLYPAFRDRSGDRDYVNVFESTPERPHRELTEWLLKG